jgi:hypothetical protein
MQITFHGVEPRTPWNVICIAPPMAHKLPTGREPVWRR